MNITPKSPDYKWPRVGVAVVIQAPGGLVLMRRAPGKHGAGHWSFPGGAVELGETFEECARREVLEEIGVELYDIVVLPHVSQDFFPEDGQHWATVYVFARTDQEPVNLEPHKCDALAVFSKDDIPQPRFVGIDMLLATTAIPD